MADETVIPTSNSGDDLSNEPLIRFVNVQKSYDGKVLVVKNLNLEVKHGEFLTFLGPSGSGKTTCLLMWPASRPSPKARFGWMAAPVENVLPTSAASDGLPELRPLSPYERVPKRRFSLEVRKVSRGEIERRVSKALALVKLEGFGDRRPGKLSGGSSSAWPWPGPLCSIPSWFSWMNLWEPLIDNCGSRCNMSFKHLQKNLGVTMVYVTMTRLRLSQCQTAWLSSMTVLSSKSHSPAELYEEPKQYLCCPVHRREQSLQRHSDENRGGFCEWWWMGVTQYERWSST